MSQYYPRDRAYSAMPAIHNVAGLYGFSDTAVNTGNGAGNPVTGNWVPVSLDANGRTQSAGSSGIFTSLFTGIINTGQVQIPVGVKAWSISVISGYAFVNGTGPLPVNTNLNGGNFGGGFISNNPINVGATGAPVNVLVYYQS